MSQKTSNQNFVRNWWEKYKQIPKKQKLTFLSLFLVLIGIPIVSQPLFFQNRQHASSATSLYDLSATISNTTPSFALTPQRPIYSTFLPLNPNGTPHNILVVGNQVWVSYQFIIVHNANGTTQTINGAISRFAFNGRSAAPDITGNGLSEPRNMLLVNGKVWVTNNGRPISVFNTDGTPAGTLGADTAQAYKGLAFVGNQIWSTNSGNQILRFNTDGTSAGPNISLAAGTQPRGLAQVGNQVWVANPIGGGRGTIIRLNLDGTPAGPDLQGPLFVQPVDIQVINNQVWISNEGGGEPSSADMPWAEQGIYINAGIVRLNFDGTIIDRITTGGTLNFVPWGKAQVGNQVWVVLRDASKIAKFDLNGKSLDTLYDGFYLSDVPYTSTELQRILHQPTALRYLITPSCTLAQCKPSYLSIPGGNVIFAGLYAGKQALAVQPGFPETPDSNPIVNEKNVSEISDVKVISPQYSSQTMHFTTPLPISKNSSIVIQYIKNGDQGPGPSANSYVGNITDTQYVHFSIPCAVTAGQTPNTVVCNVQNDIAPATPISVTFGCDTSVDANCKKPDSGKLMNPTVSMSKNPGAWTLSAKVQILGPQIYATANITIPQTLTNPLPTATPTDTQSPTDTPSVTQEPTPTQQTLQLNTNWTMVGLPLQPTTPLTAASLLTFIGDQATEVAIFQNGSYKVFIKGFTATSQDFPVTPGQGLYILAKAPTSFTLNGTPITQQPTSFAAGWDFVSFPAASGYTAKDLMASLIYQGLVPLEIAHLKDDNSGYDYIQANGGYIYGTDFTMDPSKGYWVLISKGGTWDGKLLDYEHDATFIAQQQALQASQSGTTLPQPAAAPLFK